MKRLMIGFVAIVGALMCVPAFVGCSDGVMEEVEDPDGSGGFKPGTLPLPDAVSWFDQPEEERWYLRWMLGDDMTMLGPGEYDFSVPVSGGDFDVWFPDCDVKLLYVEIDGVVYMYNNHLGNKLSDRKLITKKEFEDIHFVDEENRTRISFDPNRYGFERRFTLCFTGRNYEKLILAFTQPPGSNPIKESSGKLKWTVPDSYILSQSISGTQVYNQDLSDHFYDAELGMDGGTFDVECLNRDELYLGGITICGEDISLAEGVGTYSDGGFEIEITGGRIRFRVMPGESFRWARASIVSPDGESSSFLIRQSTAMESGYDWRKFRDVVFSNASDGTLFGWKYGVNTVMIGNEGGEYRFRCVNNISVKPGVRCNLNNDINLWYVGNLTYVEGLIKIEFINQREGVIEIMPYYGFEDRIIHVSLYCVREFMYMSSSIVFIQPPYGWQPKEQ